MRIKDKSQTKKYIWKTLIKNFYTKYTKDFQNLTITNNTI